MALPNDEAVARIRSGDIDRKRKQRAEAKTVHVPLCADRARRAALEADDFAWLRYYPVDLGTGEKLFWYEFTAQQRAMIEAIRDAIVYGGDQALAASRGEGKSTLFESMLLKYTLAGAIKFALLCKSTGGMAENALQSMRNQVERNDTLAEDYPEVCVPVRALEDTPNRAHYQLVTGHRHDNSEPYVQESSRFTWCGHEIIYPNVPGSPAAGGIIATRGLDAEVRGINKKNRRPDIVGIDDPDTEETVRSLDQARKLEERIDRGLGFLGGQRRGVARVMLTTLQRPECVSAWYTDPKRKPSFKGKRFRFLLKVPERLDLWQEYIQLWRLGMQSGDSFARGAFQFYLDNQAEMERGAEVANPNRFNPQLLPDGSQLEITALQRYYNEVARVGQEAVSTEYDNDPRDDTVASNLVSAEAIAAKVNGYPRGVVPNDAAHLTAMIDVQGKLLYWMVCAWSESFNGYVVDYGAWPEQRRSYFSLSDAVPTIPDQFKRVGLEAQLFGALTTLINQLYGREWRLHGGGTMRLTRCLIDANWGDSTDVVYQFARQSPHAGLLPTHGKAVLAKQSPMMLWPRQDGERKGLNWVDRRAAKRGQARYGMFDTNFWKSFVHARLAVAMGDKAGLSLFQAEPAVHRMLADQLHAEFPELVEAGRQVNEWKARPGRDNHLFDCLVGCAVGASMCGCGLREQAQGETRRKVTIPEHMRR